MTATPALVPADPKPAVRVATDRRTVGKDLDMTSAFAAVLDEATEDREPSKAEEHRSEREDREEPAFMPHQHFLLAAHHATVTHRTITVESLPAAAAVHMARPAEPVDVQTQPRNRPTAKPGRVVAGTESGEATPAPQLLPEAAALEPHAHMEAASIKPDTIFKPAIIVTPPSRERPEIHHQRASGEPIPQPTEKTAPQATENTAPLSADVTDIAPVHQPAPQQPPQPAEQVAKRLAPAINQAQAILRILEKAGEAGPVVKTLQFGLRPRDLGEVRVTLSLGTGELSLRIETQSEEAAQRLERDRSLLDTMLAQAGVNVDRSQIDIRAARFESQQPAASFEGAGPRSGGGTDSSAAQDHSQRQPRSGNPHQTSEGQQHASSQSGGSDHRDRRDIYL